VIRRNVETLRDGKGQDEVVFLEPRPLRIEAEQRQEL
jgi:hypothetical protein